MVNCHKPGFFSPKELGNPEQWYISLVPATVPSEFSLC